MVSRWKYDRPMSRAAFEARFPDEASCARHLAARRWPDGFVCPACGHDRGWELKRRRASWECVACGKETSVTAGTIMHRSHLPLKTWFMAVHIVTSHSNCQRRSKIRPKGGAKDCHLGWWSDLGVRLGVGCC